MLPQQIPKRQTHILLEFEESKYLYLLLSLAAQEARRGKAL